MPECKRLLATRIISTPEALNTVSWPADHRILPIAPDEVLIIPPVETVEVDDPHAIIINDGGFAGLWLAADEAHDLLERVCEWTIPTARPAFAQGAIAEIPAKLWLEEDRVLFIIPAPYATDFEERIA